MSVITRFRQVPRLGTLRTQQLHQDLPRRGAAPPVPLAERSGSFFTEKVGDLDGEKVVFTVKTTISREFRVSVVFFIMKTSDFIGGEW